MRLPAAVQANGPLPVDLARRYQRQVSLPGFGTTGQERLRAAKIACVGAGGLGSPVLSYLAAAGVGTIGVIDFDVVEESNLHRQVIHRHEDLGRSKAQSARTAIEALNPAVEVRVHEERLGAANALSILADYDVVVDGTDTFATRYLVNDACVLLGRPYVWGSILRFDGQASVFWAEHGPCYRCVHPRPPAPGSVPSCAEGGVLGVVCATIGSIQATEAIKVVTGIGDALVGRILIYDALAMQTDIVPVRKDPDCAICGTRPTITELIDDDAFCARPPVEHSSYDLPPERVAARLTERGSTGLVLVDVREPHEHASGRIPGSILVPVGRFLDGSALVDLPAGAPIVLFCQVGVRSAQALAVLRASGRTDVAHLAGGFEAWVAHGLAVDSG